MSHVVRMSLLRCVLTTYDDVKVKYHPTSAGEESSGRIVKILGENEEPPTDLHADDKSGRVIIGRQSVYCCGVVCNNEF